MSSNKLIHNVYMPDSEWYRVPGIPYESADETETPSIAKYYDGTTETTGTLAPSADTYGDIYIVPSAPLGQGMSVTWNQSVTSGVKIAEIGINGVTTEVYTPDATEVAWTQIEPSTSKKIATITIDGTATDVYAPNGAEYTLTQDTTDGHILYFSKDGTVTTTITIPEAVLANFSATESSDHHTTVLSIEDDTSVSLSCDVPAVVYVEPATADEYYPVIGSLDNAGALYQAPATKQSEGAVTSAVSFNPSSGDLAMTSITIGTSTNSWTISIDSSGNMIMV